MSQAQGQVPNVQTVRHASAAVDRRTGDLRINVTTEDEVFEFVLQLGQPLPVVSKKLRSFANLLSQTDK